MQNPKSLRIPVLACVLIVAGFVGAQHSEHSTSAGGKALPDHLKIKGDVSGNLALAKDWVMEPWIREGKTGPITRAPFWCSACKESPGYATKGTAVPPEPTAMAKRPVADLLSWWKNDSKLKPILIAMRNTVLMIDLPPMASKTLDTMERAALEDQFGKLDAQINPHQRAHLYALRCLRMEARFVDLMCLDPGKSDFIGPPAAGHLGSRSRGEVYVFPLEKPYQEFGRHFFGGFGKWTSWWYHDQVEACIASVNGGDVPDPILESRFDHQMAHHFFFQYRTFRHYVPKWIPEGLGLYFERRHKEHENTLCVLGTPANWDLKEDDWWKEIKTAVSRNEETPIARLALLYKDTDPDTLMQPKQYVQAWSLVSYMLGLGKDRWRRFVDIIKSKNENETLPELQYRAIETVYGVDSVTFHKAWREWVLATKPAPKK